MKAQTIKVTMITRGMMQLKTTCKIFRSFLYLSSIESVRWKEKVDTGYTYVKFDKKYISGIFTKSDFW